MEKINFNNIVKLNQSNLKHLPDHVKVPQYERSKINASIVHIGVGGFHRSHQALYAEKLIEEHGVNDCGICGIGILPHDKKMFNVLKSQDYLYTLMTKEFDGSLKTRVVGSIIDFLFAPDSPEAVIEKMSSPDVKIISLTITEGGYNFNEASKGFNFENPLIRQDLLNPCRPSTVFGYIAQALKRRKENKNGGCSVQSCDNIQGNGDLCKKMLCAFIEKYDRDLLGWVIENVSFPNSMVDRITPATVESDREILRSNFNVDDQWPVVCEPFTQWIIEDNFLAGRPPWEKVGVQFVPDVLPYENMKLRLLNAGHSILGILGALHGYSTIDEAANDQDFKIFLRSFMDIEVSPFLTQLDGINLNQYKDSLIGRFQNKNIKDQIPRICSYSSAKIPVFILPTIRRQLENKKFIHRASFLLAAWCRYNSGRDEKGNAYQIEDKISDALKEASLVSKSDPLEFLKIKSVFGDLSENEELSKVYCQQLKKLEAMSVKECVKEINSN